MDNSLKILLCAPRGFCAGVDRAVDIVEKSLAKLKWLSTESDISVVSSFTGAFVGAYSHILLDSFMHFDVKPFEPFFSKTFVGIISIDSLHLSLVGLFIFGLIVYLFRKFR